MREGSSWSDAFLVQLSSWISERKEKQPFWWQYMMAKVTDHAYLSSSMLSSAATSRMNAQSLLYKFMIFTNKTEIFRFLHSFLAKNAEYVYSLALIEQRLKVTWTELMKDFYMYRRDVLNFSWLPDPERPSTNRKRSHFANELQREPTFRSRRVGRAREVDRLRVKVTKSKRDEISIWVERFVIHV